MSKMFINNAESRAAAGVVFCLMVAASVVAKDKPPKTYPERGQIVGFTSPPGARGGGVYPDADGGVPGSTGANQRVPVWTLRSASIEYRIESTSPVRAIWMKPAKGPGELAADVAFRVHKGMIYIQYGDKERRYRIVGERLLNPHATDSAPKK